MVYTIISSLGTSWSCGLPSGPIHNQMLMDNPSQKWTLPLNYMPHDNLNKSQPHLAKLNKSQSHLAKLNKSQLHLAKLNKSQPHLAKSNKSQSHLAKLNQSKPHLSNSINPSHYIQPSSDPQFWLTVIIILKYPTSRKNSIIKPYCRHTMSCVAFLMSINYNLM